MEEIKMKEKQYIQFFALIGLILLLNCTNLLPAMQPKSDIILPPPDFLEMNLEETMFRRKSVRNFTDEPVTDAELSTILWGAYGIRDTYGHTVTGLNGLNGAVIYVLREDGAYIYNPINHSLEFYKAGDWRGIVGWQYTAPIQLGICYNTDIVDSFLGGAEIGMIDQNIQFIVNALDMGTVVTAQVPPAIEPLELPENHKGVTVMPIGHPDYINEFRNQPLWISLLPRIKKSSLSITECLKQRNESNSFEGVLTRQELSQIIWATCGFSPYKDVTQNEIYHKGRHRTIPSGKGYYPVDIYAIKKSGIFRYQSNLLVDIFYAVPIDYRGLPIITYLLPIKLGDHRQIIADACNQPQIASAPLTILSVLDREKTKPEGMPDLSDDIFLPTWYHDAGAAAHNVLLEATAWDLTANVFTINDVEAIQSLLKLDTETTIPLFSMPIGK